MKALLGLTLIIALLFTVFLGFSWALMAMAEWPFVWRAALTGFAAFCLGLIAVRGVRIAERRGWL